MTSRKPILVLIFGSIAIAVLILAAALWHGGCGGSQKTEPAAGSPLASVCFHGLRGAEPVAVCAATEATCNVLRNAALTAQADLEARLQVAAIGECR